MGYGYDITRKNVILEGVPFKWNTNMSDDDLRDLYELIRNDLDGTKPAIAVDRACNFSLSLRMFDRFIPFRQGSCHCLGIGDTLYAIYKTSIEWELWAARQQELKELREEQEIERRVEHELAKATANHLISRCAESLEI